MSFLVCIKRNYVTSLTRLQRLLRIKESCSKVISTSRWAQSPCEFSKLLQSIFALSSIRSATQFYAGNGRQLNQLPASEIFYLTQDMEHMETLLGCKLTWQPEKFMGTIKISEGKWIENSLLFTMPTIAFVLNILFHKFYRSLIFNL